MTEFESWFDKCINKETDETDILWTFSENIEHSSLLKIKRVSFFDILRIHVTVDPSTNCQIFDEPL